MTRLGLMDESTFRPEPAGESSGKGADPTREDVPRFGAVDIVEAFTAMRHEWRGQTKESRSLAEQIEAAAASIQTLEAKLLARVGAMRSDDSAEARRLALIIVETDHQLTRAIAAIARWEEHRRQRALAERDAIERCVAGMNRVVRWLARRLLTLLAEQAASPGSTEEQPATEGLNMVLARLRRQMREQGIERMDVLGQPFDAATMYAIGTVSTMDYPEGHVAEQLSPAYGWQGQPLRFADVRVADRTARGAGPEATS